MQRDPLAKMEVASLTDDEGVMPSAYDYGFFPTIRDSIFDWESFSSDILNVPRRPYVSSYEEMRRYMLFSIMAAMMIVIAGIVIGPVIKSDVAFWNPYDPLDPDEPPGPSSSRRGFYDSAAVVSDNKICANIGSKIFGINGSAVDAAIAVLLCEGLVNQANGGLGGGFLMVVQMEGNASVINALPTAPDRSYGLMENTSNRTVFDTGPTSIAVPGQLSGLWLAHQKFGRLPWKDLLTPTIKLCYNGFKVSHYLADLLDTYEVQIQGSDSLRTLFINNKTGTVFRRGDTIHMETLAKTLEILATDGAAAFYEGVIGDKIVSDIKTMGGVMEKEDLVEYSSSVQNALEFMMIRDGHRMFTAGLPGAGVVLGVILQILQGFLKDESNIVNAHRMVESFKLAFGLCKHVGTMDTDMLVEILTSNYIGTFLRQKIDDWKSLPVPHYHEDESSVQDGGSLHISILAPNGDAVAVTSTLNKKFGSLCVSESTGIILNNIMLPFYIQYWSSNFTATDENKDPFLDILEEYKHYMNADDDAHNTCTDVSHNCTDARERCNKCVSNDESGIRHDSANRRNWRNESLKKVLIYLCPVIIVDSNNVVQMVVGGAGGSVSITAVAQVIIKYLWELKTLKDAVDERRLHYQLVPSYMKYEYGIVRDIVDGLRSRGHVVERYSIPQYERKYYAEDSAVNAITAFLEYITANGDFRRGAGTDGL